MKASSDESAARRICMMLTGMVFAMLFIGAMSHMACAATLDEYSGADRYETSALVDEMFQQVVPNSHAALLVSGNDFPDALVASSLAGVKNCPVLLTDTEELPEATRKRLVDDCVTQLYLIGGQGAISDEVAAEAADIVAGNRAASSTGTETDPVIRISGSDRRDTACKLMNDYSSRWGDTLIIATGKVFADSASIAPLAFKGRYPILLASDDGSLDAQTEATLESALGKGAFTRVIIVGGTSAVSDSVSDECARLIGSDQAVVRLSGADRFSTSAAVSSWCVAQGYLSYSNMALAFGWNFPDALCGGVLQGASGSVTLLVDESATGKAAYRSMLDSLGTVRLLGGTSVISDYIRTELKSGVIDRVEIGQAAATYCLSKVGCRYSQDDRWLPDVYDCSSLAYRCYSETTALSGYDIGVATADTGQDAIYDVCFSAANEAAWCVQRGATLSVNQLRPGDWIFFGGSSNGRYRGIYHVAVYVGNGQVVQAKGDDYGVVLSDFTPSNIGLYGRPY